MAESAELLGIAVLVVEDEFLLAVEIAEYLAAAGASVVGPRRPASDVGSSSAAREAHCAVVDVDTPRGPAYAAAASLRASGIPFAFVTGDPTFGADPRFEDVPVVVKPIDPVLLTAAVAALVGRTRDADADPTAAP